MIEEQNTKNLKPFIFFCLFFFYIHVIMLFLQKTNEQNYCITRCIIPYIDITIRNILSRPWYVHSVLIYYYIHGSASFFISNPFHNSEIRCEFSKMLSLLFSLNVQEEWFIITIIVKHFVRILEKRKKINFVRNSRIV